MARVGVLGLEPFVVNQVEHLDRDLEVVLLDAIDDDARADLEMDVVLVNAEHAGSPRMIGSHPNPPIVIVDESHNPAEDENRPADAPLRLGRPISSPELLDAIDRSRGLGSIRRSMRAITIEQDDSAVTDRWAAVIRTVVSLGVLTLGSLTVADPTLFEDVVPWTVPALVAITAWVIGRALWWRLTPPLVVVDALVVFGLVAALDVDLLPLTLLAAAVALEASFAIGVAWALTGAVVAMGLVVTGWAQLFDRPPPDDAVSAGLLVLTAAATGGLVRRLWREQTQSRSGELRQFRSALYDLSRRQAVVAVSFDIGTVAEDALARLIADVQPRAALVLVADGPGPLQVGASHNLQSQAPVRLTWKPGLSQKEREERDEAVMLTPDAANTARVASTIPTKGVQRDLPDWAPSHARETDGSEGSAPADGRRPGGPSPQPPPAAASPPAGNPSPAPPRTPRPPTMPADSGSSSSSSVPPPAAPGPPGEPDLGAPRPAVPPDQAGPSDPAGNGEAGVSGSLMRRMEEARRQRGKVSRKDIDRHAASSRFDGNATSGDVDDPGERPPETAAEQDDRLMGRRRAHPGQRTALASLLDRTTIQAVHTSRLVDVLEQLGPSLPDGPIHVHGAELDNELMGALVVVGATDPRPISRHAEETALALDSVRLFNRLRAFTRDQERARIGRSLHDGVMQTLAHVAFELDRVSNDSWDDSQVETLGRLRDHVLGTVDEMRTVVNDLRTVRLDRGLPAALEAMALTLSPAGGPVIEVTTTEVGTLPGEVEEQYLRIAEEALMNAVRHSGGRGVTVNLRRQNGALLLQVADDGFGFTQSKVGSRDGGVGLTSMYQRARAVGAGLDIDTGANGTIITVLHTMESGGAPPPAAELVAPVNVPLDQAPAPRRGRRRRRR